MADCDTYNRAVLWAYLRNQLSVEETIRMQYHLSVCAHCRKQIADMRKLSLAMASEKQQKGRNLLFVDKSSLRWAASFLILLSAGLSYYVISTDKLDEYPVEIKRAPTFEEVDSVIKEVDSLVVLPDSVLKK